MAILPAKIAGVKEVVVCTPKASAEILFACELCGADRIFEIGGAMAIAAMAYGTETVPKVNKIIGPGTLTSRRRKKLSMGMPGSILSLGQAKSLSSQTMGRILYPSQPICWPKRNTALIRCLFALRHPGNWEWKL